MIISTCEVLCALVTAGGLGRPPIGETAAVRPGEDEVRWCKAAVKLAPGVRIERVEAIRSALTVANYRVSTDEVARKMIERSLVDTAFAAGITNPWP